MRGFLFIGALLSTAPQWTAVHEASFFSYQDKGAIEKPETALRNMYEFPASPLGAPAACSYDDVFPWFVNAGGADLTGTHPYRNPSTGSIAGPFRGVTGLEFTGSFGGKATGAQSDYVWEVVFFHEQKCYSGGIEFGFRRDAVGGAFQAYWSINSNCSLDVGQSTSGCRAARGSGAHIQEATGAVNLPYAAGVKRYRMSAVGDKFLIEISQPKPWSVSVDPNAPGAWFHASADPRARFPIEELAAKSGYVTVGVQRSATETVKPDPQNPPAMRVQSLNLARPSMSGRVTVKERNGSVITDAQFSDYELHIVRPVEWSSAKGHLVLRQGSRTILTNDEFLPELQAWRGDELFPPDSELPFDSTVEIARDITGDGVPELLFTDEPAGGGNAVMTSWTVVSLGSMNRVIAELGGDAAGGNWHYAKGQKLPVFETAEAWPWWGAPHDFCSCHWCVGTHVTLQYRDGAFRLATELMRKPAPSPEALKELASKLPASTVAGCPSLELPNNMLELIFSGNAPSAYRFLDLAWPGDSPDKRVFRSEFLKRLEASGYCRDVRCQ